jgi:hypothetical protein
MIKSLTVSNTQLCEVSILHMPRSYRLSFSIIISSLSLCFEVCDLVVEFNVDFLFLSEEKFSAWEIRMKVSYTVGDHAWCSDSLCKY